ncbi:phosphoribosylamine--glycine ligase [Candidatus Nitrosacidococcus sp. I8]|uniref:phosphoribosylamine--glycine ligase n=1 Tax=Candidatus Nitrosacidococcus sp. I8 TaxID=2942908 RepID=UPI0022276C50|nr:phosphoribosylamine--glycine ligase [Candidatus Nitrosacidococcus sp. I8]CAH9015729.1 Phosphoribosylamine--glycine ligase [Candidatus Nitrosacidococcus sp. I8]
MKALVVGGGGREHALAWKLAQSSQISQVYVAPGNPGTALEFKVKNIPIKADDVVTLVNFALSEQVKFTLVGPEAPLMLGIVDTFEKAGLNCFGPHRLAARLEESKSFAKSFLTRHGIPTARYQVFDIKLINRAVEYIYSQTMPIVIKADGLAAGKGVIIAHSHEEAVDAVQSILLDNIFGEAGKQIVIEEFLAGEEASFIVMADGKNILPFASSQDHKARDNMDKGPNTGGMGAYSPAPVITEAIYHRVIEEIILPTIHGMAKEGHPYKGFLYAGLMIDETGTPKVLEYNCRFGDPETQPIMMRLQSDLAELCMKAIEGNLDKTSIEWDSKAALGVVMAAKGYPSSYPINDLIYGLPLSKFDGMSKVFHAGTIEKEGRILTAGGRVLCVCSLGDSITEAQRTTYSLVQKITWQNSYYRTDIGYRAIARENNL